MRKSGNDLKDSVRSALGGVDGIALRRYVMAALDPSVRYGVTGKLVGGAGTLGWTETAHYLLDSLSSRQLTGNAAKTELANFVEYSSPETVDLMNRVLNKDMRCGVAETLINSLSLPNFSVPVFTCQLAAPTGTPDEQRKARKRMERGEWVVSTKFDGMRGLGLVDDNRVHFVSRSGKPVPALQHLEKQVLDVFGGHRVVVDCEGVGVDFLDSISQLRSKSIERLEDTTLLQIFDCVPLEAFRDARGDDKFGGPLRDRLARLREFIANTDAPNLMFAAHSSVHDYDEAQYRADQLMEDGFEGCVAKDLTSGYSRKRTNDWIKFKATDNTTCLIVGLKEGEAGKQFEGMLGSATVEVDGILSDVGMGWSRFERAAIWAAYTGKTVAVTVRGKLVEAEPDAAFRILSRLLDVRHNGRMTSGALRHARKMKFRDIGGEIA